MNRFVIPGEIDRNDLKKLRNKLQVTQAEFAGLINVSKKTVERWESSDKGISGPITTLFHLLNNDPDLVGSLRMPKQAYPLRLKYFFRHQLCTVIDVDERSKKVAVHNFQTELIYRAFGKVDSPSYEAYEDFLESRCVPRDRDKMKLVLRELDIPFYDPMMIIEKTQGRMAEDEFWLEIERKTS